MKSNTDYGIVAIGRNEGVRLQKCLRSIRDNTKGVIIVYVDSGSIDDSVTIAEQMGAFVVRLTPPFSAARARNEGFAALKLCQPQVRFVQFIDGDCEIIAGWLVTALTFIRQHDDVAVACGRRLERCPSASVYNRLCDLEWDTPIGLAASCGGDSLVRAEAFEVVNGFRSQLIAGEEPELCLRLRQKGWKIWRLDAEMTRHDAAMTRFGQWWRRCVRFGYATAELALLHGQSPLVTWKREVGRPIFWAGIVPFIIILGALVQPVAILGLLVYPLQIARIALRRDIADVESWIYGLFITLAKFPELQGVATYYWRRQQKRSVELIEYR